MALNSRYSIVDYDERYLPSLVACYIATFATPPWNEWMRCSECSRHYGLDVPERCESCGGTLIPFYSDDQVKQYFARAQILRGHFHLAVAEQEIVAGWRGFVYGSLDVCNDAKLHLPADELARLRSRVAPFLACSWGLGVHPEHRRRGLGLALTEASFMLAGRPMLIRTSTDETVPVRRLHERFAFIEVYRYPDNVRALFYRT